jgi:hypothetical protein
MPAHKSKAHVGKLRLSNGEFLTEPDVKANDMADGFAKEAVEEHRVPKVEVENWKKLESDAMHIVKWTGKAVNLACNTETYPFKDNEAARWKAKEAKANKAKLKEERKKEDERKRKEDEGKEKAHQPGRHLPQKVTHLSGMRNGWRCRICRCISSTKAKLEDKKCLGAAASRWEEMAATAAADAQKDSDGHTRVYSGEVVWCSTCGAYAD